MKTPRARSASMRMHAATERNEVVSARIREHGRSLAKLRARRLDCREVERFGLEARGVREDRGVNTVGARLLPLLLLASCAETVRGDAGTERDVPSVIDASAPDVTIDAPDVTIDAPGDVAPEAGGRCQSSADCPSGLRCEMPPGCGESIVGRCVEATCRTGAARRPSLRSTRCRARRGVAISRTRAASLRAGHVHCARSAHVIAHRVAPVNADAPDAVRRGLAGSKHGAIGGRPAKSVEFGRLRNGVSR